MKIKVKFQGFLQTVEREFPTPEAAETWLRQIGKWQQAEWPVEISTDWPPLTLIEEYTLAPLSV
jgi:hypothetical protein